MKSSKANIEIGEGQTMWFIEMLNGMKVTDRV